MGDRGATSRLVRIAHPKVSDQPANQCATIIENATKSLLDIGVAPGADCELRPTIPPAVIATALSQSEHVHTTEAAMAVSWTRPPGPADTGPSIANTHATLVSEGLPMEIGTVFEQLAHRVRSEYKEMPGLNVTRDQARCLWALEPETCDRLLDHLVRTGFLIRTLQNTYVRAT
jgi:hypothetical protein